MAKKKKTQLKSVARGFATTSVPKKVQQGGQLDNFTDVIETLPAMEKSFGNEKEVTEILTGNLDHDKQQLQLLVDRFQEKTDKEIIRTFKVSLLISS